MFKELAVGLAVGLPLLIGAVVAPWIIFGLAAIIGILVMAYMLGVEILDYKRRYM